MPWCAPRRADAAAMPRCQSTVKAWHPLHFAVDGGHADVVAFLLEKGADADAKTVVRVPGARAAR